MSIDSQPGSGGGSGITLGHVRIANTSDTLTLADANGTILLNSASAITETVPLNAVVAFPINTQISIVQYGTGAASIAFASGVTPRYVSTSNFVGQMSRVVLTKIGTDEWLMDGGLQ